MSSPSTSTSPAPRCRCSASDTATAPDARPDHGVGRPSGRLAITPGFGHVRNLLDNATRPDEADETVEVRGRTSYGDITIHRS
jgi:hypothetical protein